MRGPLGIHVDRHRHEVGRNERLVVGTLRIRIGLTNLHTEVHEVIHQLHGGNDHVDAALVRAEAITAGITAEVGGKDETGIVDIDFLALGVHKYQSPFTC